MPVKARKKKNFARFIPLYLMMVPGAVYLIINNYIPMAGIVLAFKKFNYGKGIWKSPFIGLQNFTSLFSGNQIWIAVKNTLLYNVAFIALGMLVAVSVAIILSMISAKKSKNFYQGMILIPYLISIVIVSYMVYGLLSTDKGLINQLIVAMGGEPVSWYTTPGAWPVILTIINLWKGFGYSSIIYYTTILGIDPSIYEAADMDGAGKWKQIIHITLPSLKTTIVTMLILSVGKIFYSDFGLFYQVPQNSGTLLSVTQTVDTYVYRALMNQNAVGLSAAGGLVQSVLGFFLVLATNLLVTRIDSESSLF